MVPNKRIDKQVIFIDPSTGTDRAGWVDHLICWIDRLPFPPWIFYLGLLAIFVFLVYLSYWLDGTSPFGSMDIPFPVPWLPFYCVAFLAAIHFTNKIALRSFDKFSPALGKTEEESSQLRYQLTTTPKRAAWMMAVVGAIFTIPVFFLSSYVTAEASTKLSFIYSVFIAILGFIMTAELLYHTVHQLRLVSYIHSSAGKINLMDLTPVYAFSNLSAQTGLIFLMVLWFDLLFIPETFTNPALIILNAVGLGLLAVACFILPLLGMHQRLVLEKQHLLWEVNRRIQASSVLLYEKVDANDLHDADATNKAINSLIVTHDFIMKIPTWPWRPETFTLFISALTLPTVVYIIQLLLRNLIVFK